jgi:1-deoxy-D-xylulose 5-phosphate reductoisomerase
MIFTLNTDNQTAEILEGQRRYREMLASEHAAGVIEAETRLNSIIADKDAAIADKDAALADKDAIIEKLLSEIDSLKHS